MSLEDVTFIGQLVITNPDGATDTIDQGDDHLRLIKRTLVNSCPNITSTLVASAAELNNLDGYLGNTNDLNVLQGAASAGVQTTDVQILAGAASAGIGTTHIAYLAGLTSTIQAQIDALKHKGALVYHHTAIAVSNGTFLPLTWGSEEYDTDAIHDTVTNNTRLTVPAGVTRVVLTGQILWSGNATGQRAARIDKNGTSAYVGKSWSLIHPSNATSLAQQVKSPVLTVTSGDYFELKAYQTSGGSLNVNPADGDQCWFSMEIIE